jgi:hypothetical protein
MREKLGSQDKVKACTSRAAPGDTYPEDNGNKRDKEVETLRTFRDLGAWILNAGEHQESPRSYLWTSKC